MSNEDGGKVEDQGIPGYSANNTIPGGFSLPLPTATNSIDPEPEAETDETADPWSSTWDDTSWQLPDSNSSESLYSSEELANYAGGGTTSASDWGDSYDHGGEPALLSPEIQASRKTIAAHMDACYRFYDERERGRRDRERLGVLGAVRRVGLRPRHGPLVRSAAQRRDRGPVDGGVLRLGPCRFGPNQRRALLG